MRFPRFRGKHALPSAIHPSEHQAYVRERAPNAGLDDCAGVILLYQSSVLRRTISQYQPSLPEDWCRGELRFIAHEGKRVALCGGFGVGAPAAALVLEQLVSLGAPAVITVGTAAGLQPSLSAGDAVLCNRALRDEGTSYHYAPPDEFACADSDLTEAFGRALRMKALCYQRGDTWTTDAPYRETAAEVDSYQQRGLLTADMESSAVFTVARHRGIPAAAGMAVADSLAKRSPRTFDPRTVVTLDRLVEGALTTLACHPGA
ncbi:hypothetical protein [Streptomyces natalensis]|uniref:nucleoside phosphorylase n=1 Tax=Streptomyces natalensis TaxID=68242 RepID=UPI0005C8A6FD